GSPWWQQQRWPRVGRRRRLRAVITSRRRSGISLARKFATKTAKEPRRCFCTFVLSQGERRPAVEAFPAALARGGRAAPPGNRGDHGVGRHRVVEVSVRGARWQLGA